MSKDIEDKLAKIPLLNILVALLKKVKLPGLEGLSVYDLLEMYIVGIINGALTSRAGAVAFSFFMAIFPTLLFFLNLLPFIPIENFQANFIETITSFLPNESGNFLNEIIVDIVKNKRSGLLSTTFLLSIFLMANGVSAIFAGFENSYYIQTKRNFFKQYLYALSVGILLALLLIFTIAVLGYVELYIPYLSEFAGKTTGFRVESGDELGVTIAKFSFLVFMVYLGTAILYYFGTHQARKAKFFSPGVLLTTVLIVLTSYLFGIYIANFSQYNELYGSIGALLILMMYIWLNSNILLLGFELNASLNMLKNKKQQS
ncbi:YihY/virulence factor BrkB family protein [Kordia sp. YSTF-M3]|uniref:YihY/virulence factor BrkB family protein n=1 Tax=Kordia aestuariivivens TaxID=2759037 RepID=A0ABR7QE02_9FLAO|nr:YihY/virulence factor BrkB family protein [Kordia aestuariivivens]MBC8756810.1 YihY/virulence factor BrkB family protein [Kordia aestuariivivens]